MRALCVVILFCSSLNDYVSLGGVCNSSSHAAVSVNVSGTSLLGTFSVSGSVSVSVNVNVNVNVSTCLLKLVMVEKWSYREVDR